MTEIDIHKLNLLWVESKHPKNNPKRYNLLNNDSTDNVSQRKKDLVQLLRIIFNFIHEPDNKEYFKNLKDDNLDSFNKYLKTRVIDYYPLGKDPFEQEVFSKEYVIENIEESKYKIWLLTLFTIASKRASWQPKLDLNDISDNILKIRFVRFQLLSKICCFIDEIQTNDYLTNNITILNEKGIITGKTDKLVYGHKHILSAYLGQHIVRMFPFKDFNHFKSIEFEKNNTCKSVYEHFTPMSFFRDLIWVKLQSQAGNLFDNNSKPFNEHQWLSILWYAYRTIDITMGEDKKLNEKNKSRRLFDCYDKLTIPIQIHNKTNWDEFHSLDSLKSNLHESGNNWFKGI